MEELFKQLFLARSQATLQQAVDEDAAFKQQVAQRQRISSRGPEGVRMRASRLIPDRVVQPPQQPGAQVAERIAGRGGQVSPDDVMGRSAADFVGIMGSVPQRMEDQAFEDSVAAPNPVPGVIYPSAADIVSEHGAGKPARRQAAAIGQPGSDRRRMALSESMSASQGPQMFPELFEGETYSGAAQLLADHLQAGRALMGDPMAWAALGPRI